MLNRAELAAAGRRKLEEFRKQKAAGKGGATAPGAPQQPAAAAPPPPPAHERALLATSTSGSTTAAINGDVLRHGEHDTLRPDGLTAGAALLSAPVPEPPLAVASVGQPTPAGGQDGAAGISSAGPDLLGGYQRRLPPPMPTYTWQPPQRSAPEVPTAEQQVAPAASTGVLARPPLPPSQPREDSLSAQGGSVHGSTAANSLPSSAWEAESSRAGLGGSGRGGLFGSFGSLFGSAAAAVQQPAAAGAAPEADEAAPTEGAKSYSLPLDSADGQGSLGGRPSWLQPSAAATADSQSSWQREQQQQQQQQQGAVTATAPVASLAAAPAAQLAAPAAAPNSWASGYAALSDTYASPSKEPAPAAGVAVQPPAAAAQRLFDSGAGSGGAGSAANGLAAPLAAAAVAAAAEPAAPSAAGSIADGLPQSGAAAPSVSSAGAGSEAGVSPAHSRQPSDASAVSSLLAPHPSSLVSGGGGAAAPAAAAAALLPSGRPGGGLPTSGSVGKFGAPQSRAQEFKALQQHIDELTEEKFMLQRGMEQQAKLAETLLEENEAMARRHNDQGAEVEQLQRQVRELQQMLAAQTAAVDAAHAERDAYKLSAQELQERSKALAAEVVALEEQVLQLKSSHLRDRSQASGASEVARAMQAQLEAVSKERGALLDEVHRLREESAEARHTIKRLQQQQAASAASAAAVAAQQAQAQAGRQGEAADGKQQEPAGAQQEQQGAVTAAVPDAAAEQGAEEERQRLRQEHAAEVARLQAELSLAHRQNAELQQQLAHAQAQPGAAAGAAAADGRQQLGASPAASAAATPTAAAAAAGPAVSAFISQSALREAVQRDQQPAAAQQAEQAGGLPPELAALLPAALYSLPAGGLSSSGPGVAGSEAALQLTSSIYLLLDALEEDKRQIVAALNAKQEEVERELRARQALEQKLAAQQRQLELAQQQQAVGSGGSSGSGDRARSGI